MKAKSSDRSSQTEAQPAEASTTPADEVALIEAVLKGYPASMARSDALRACKTLAAHHASAPPAAPAVQKLLTEHSGCGMGTQVDQLKVRLNPGDKVVLIKGRITQAIDAADGQAS